VPKVVKALSKSQVNKINEQGMHPVGGVPGLYLRIVGNSKSWVYIVSCGVRLNRKGLVVPRRLNMGLGSASAIDLHQARDRARLIKNKISLGVDPLQEKKRLRELDKLQLKMSVSFRHCAESYLKMKRHEWNSEKHFLQWQSTLSTYVYPFIGAKKIREITTDEIMSILTQPVKCKDGTKQQFWVGKTETASRVRGRIASIIDWSIAKGFRDVSASNPACWDKNLKYLLPSPTKLKSGSHFCALHYSDVPFFVQTLLEHIKSSDDVKYRALLFTILTVTRTKEARFCSYTEITKGLLTIPAIRTKTKRNDLKVPLSSQCLSILNGHTAAENEGLIFMRGNKPLSENCLLGVMRSLGYEKETVHGFRSAFKDWCRTERGTIYADEVSELCLGHVNSDATRSAYARDQLLSLRAKLLADWADYCFSVAT
jgi:hypothetical protein